MDNNNQHFQAFENWLEHRLPDKLRQLLADINGAQCGDVIRFYAPDELLERNETYQTKHYCPGWITIGDDGGGNAVMVVADLSDHRVFLVDHGAMTTDCFVPVAIDLACWINDSCPIQSLSE